MSDIDTTHDDRETVSSLSDDSDMGLDATDMPAEPATDPLDDEDEDEDLDDAEGEGEA